MRTRECGNVSLGTRQIPAGDVGSTPDPLQRRRPHHRPCLGTDSPIVFKSSRLYCLSKAFLIPETINRICIVPIKPRTRENARRPALGYAVKALAIIYRSTRHTEVRLNYSSTNMADFPLTWATQNLRHCIVSADHAEQPSQCHVTHKSIAFRACDLGISGRTTDMYAYDHCLPQCSPGLDQT
jgi:hypothetical protein